MKPAQKRVRLISTVAVVAMCFTVVASYLLFTRSVQKVLKTEWMKKDTRGESGLIKNAGSIERIVKEGRRAVVSMKEIRDFVYYEGKLWLASSGGLIAVSPDSKIIKVYTRLNGLPDADITSLAVDRNFLYAGSGGGFVMVIKNGELSYITLPKECGPVSALLNTPRGIIIGTGKGGVWVLKGGGLSRLGKDTAGADFVEVTALGIKDNNILVGTYNDGLFVEGAGGFAHYTEGEGLPMNHITSLVYHDGKIYAGTPAGWASISPAGAVEAHAGAFVTSIAALNGNLWAGTHRGVISLAGTSTVENLPTGKISAVKSINDSFHIVVNDEVFVKTDKGWSKIYSPPPDTISADHITALLYRNGEVWVGTFENGFDVFDAELKKKKFSYSGNTWAVNGFFADGENTIVAHNNGVSIYKDDINVKNITTADGLVGNRVSAVCAVPGGKVYATEAGITFDVAGMLRSIYAFHGLVNNHVYSCATAGGKLYAGTLGGISVISNLKVLKSFRPGESPLKSGWVSALAVSGDDLYVGTYGGGIQKLCKEKVWISYDEIGTFEVNQGAMLISDGKLLAGSTDSGLLVLDDSTGEWAFMRDGLTADSVTAVAISGEYVYVGTTAGITLIPRREFYSAEPAH